MIDNVIRNIGLAVAVWLYGGIMPLMAQTPDTLRTRNLPGVVVRGDASARALTSTAPVQLIGRADMLRLGVTDMADALHRLPGVTLRDYGGAGGMKTVSVRGFGARHTGV